MGRRAFILFDWPTIKTAGCQSSRCWDVVLMGTKHWKRKKKKLCKYFQSSDFQGQCIILSSHLWLLLFLPSCLVFSLCVCPPSVFSTFGRSRSTTPPHSSSCVGTMSADTSQSTSLSNKNVSASLSHMKAILMWSSASCASSEWSVLIRFQISDKTWTWGYARALAVKAHDCSCSRYCRFINHPFCFYGHDAQMMY